MLVSQKQMCIFYGVWEESGWVEVYIASNKYQMNGYSIVLLLTTDSGVHPSNLSLVDRRIFNNKMLLIQVKNRLFINHLMRNVRLCKVTHSS